MRLWAGLSQGLNSGKDECILSPTKFPDWLLGPHSLVVSKYCPVLTEIKRPGREPKNSRVWCAEVMKLSSKFPSVLRFQLKEQPQLKVVRMSVTDSTVNVGLWQCILVQR